MTELYDGNDNIIDDVSLYSTHSESDYIAVPSAENTPADFAAKAAAAIAAVSVTSFKRRCPHGQAIALEPGADPKEEECRRRPRRSRGKGKVRHGATSENGAGAEGSVGGLDLDALGGAGDGSLHVVEYGSAVSEGAAQAIKELWRLWPNIVSAGFNQFGEEVNYGKETRERLLAYP